MMQPVSSVCQYEMTATLNIVFCVNKYQSEVILRKRKVLVQTLNSYLIFEAVYNVDLSPWILSISSVLLYC